MDLDSPIPSPIDVECGLRRLTITMVHLYYTTMDGLSNWAPPLIIIASHLEGLLAELLVCPSE